MLRALDDAATLARNPLVAHLFRSAGLGSDDERRAGGRVRACVERATRSLIDMRSDVTAIARERHIRRHAILTRCDLLGEPHARVAGELGICLRQFYRERRAACAYVHGRIVAELGPVRDGAITALACDDVPLELAVRLRNVGQFDRALAVYDDLLAGASDERAVALLVERLALLKDAARVDEADGTLARLRQHAARAPRAHDASLAVALAEALLYTARLEHAKAAAVCRSITAGAAQDFEGASPAVLHVTLEAHMLLVLNLVELRDLDAARRVHDRCRVLLDRCERAPSETEGAWLEAAFTFAYLGSHLRDASAAFARAKDAARTHGQIRRLVQLEGMYGSLNTQLGNVEAGVSYAERAVTLARAVGTPLELADTLGRLARAEAARGADGRTRIAAILREARGLAPTDAFVAALASLAQAEVSLRMRRYQPAITLARTAARAFEAHRFSRAAGLALHAGAVATFRAGDAPQARRWIRTALDYFERFGTRVDIARTLAASATITDNRDHRVRADTLLRDLQG